MGRPDKPKPVTPAKAGIHSETATWVPVLEQEHFGGGLFVQMKDRSGVPLPAGDIA